MLHWPVLCAVVLLLASCSPRFISIVADIPEEDVPPAIGLHYVISNENRLDLFYPNIHERGGLFIGVGTDQNLLLMSWAESTGAILIDRDAFAVLTNRLHLRALKSCDSYIDFRHFWSDATRVRSAVRVTQPKISDADLSHYMELVNHPRGIAYRLRRLEGIARKTGVENFTSSPKLFGHLKFMATADAIRVLRADLAGRTTMQNLAAQLKAIGIPLSLVYVSNIEDYPMDAKALRHNLGLFAIEEDALLLRTLNRLDGVAYSFPAGEEFGETQPFHYNMQKLADFVSCGLPRREKTVAGLQAVEAGLSKLQCGNDIPH